MAEDFQANPPVASGKPINFQDKYFLVIDDVAGMRSSMRATIGSMGGVRIDMAGNGIEAISRLEQRYYDVILCDYGLGDGKDGQQLLEEIKRRKLVRNSTIFMMVTAERGYEKVVSAAELAPDDYLIKPFAGEVLWLRLERLAQKKAYFAPVYDLMDKQDYRRAIQACDEILKSPSQYVIDLMRLKAEICLLLGDYAQSRELYEQALAIREIPWARMGLGKSLFYQNDFDLAAAIFRQVTEDNPSYMSAYDWLAKAHSAIGDERAAQRALMAATVKSPRMLQRRKTLGETAYSNDDLETAQNSFEAVLDLGRNSAFIAAEDYANLSRVFIDKDNYDQALAVMKDARKVFNNSPDAVLHGAIMDSLAYGKSGDKAAAAAELKKALEFFNTSENKPGSVSLDIARACFQLGDEETGKKIVQDFIKNNHDDQKIHGYAEDMFRKIGQQDKGRQIINDSSREVADLNNQAVQMAQAGDLKGAANLLMQATAKYPENTEIALSAAHAILACMQKQGWGEELSKAAKQYLAAAKNRDPDNRKCLMLVELYKEVAQQYGLRL